MLALLLTTALALAGYRTWAPAGTCPGSAPRLALVIANDSYRHVERLEEARNDARAVGQALEQSCFQVHEHWDLDRAGMAEALADFTVAVARERPEAVFVYYAGHAAQVDNQSYLLPIDAQPPTPQHLAAVSMPLALLMSDLAAAGAPRNVVVVDGCRDNPFRGSWVTQYRSQSGLGLGSPPTEVGFLVAYPTAPGSVTRDGVYASPLAEAIAADCSRLEDVFKWVHSRVRERTAGSLVPQLPWYHSALGEGEFYFNRRGCEVQAPAAATPPPTAAVKRPERGGVALWLGPVGALDVRRAYIPDTGDPEEDAQGRVTPVTGGGGVIAWLRGRRPSGHELGMFGTAEIVATPGTAFLAGGTVGWPLGQRLGLHVGGALSFREEGYFDGTYSSLNSLGGAVPLVLEWHPLPSVAVFALGAPVLAYDRGVFADNVGFSSHYNLGLLLGL